MAKMNHYLPANAVLPPCGRETDRFFDTTIRYQKLFCLEIILNQLLNIIDIKGRLEQDKKLICQPAVDQRIFHSH